MTIYVFVSLLAGLHTTGWNFIEKTQKMGFSPNSSKSPAFSHLTSGTMFKPTSEEMKSMPEVC